METDVFLELHVPDFEKVIKFYTKLGFKIVWRSEDYLVIRRGESVLNFYGGSNKVYNQSYFKRFPKKTKRGYAVEIIVPIDDIKKFYKKIKNFVKVVEPLKLKKWGRWDFRIEDPFGFYLRFTERYDWLNKLDKNQKELISKYKRKKRS
jgi:catechol 2,3-dioxygenase-like lactoylglutathione lyase family enzyme